MTGDGPLFRYAERKRKPRKGYVERVEPPLEWKLQQTIVRDILDKFLKPSWRFTHPANGELRDKATAGKLKGMGVRAGVPDLCFWSPTGLGHFLELKRHRTEELEGPQLDFQQWCKEHGIPHRVAWDVDGALAAFAEWDCLRYPIGGGRRD
jgi:hypothetical protein